jgi:hypothetical protein
MMVDPYAPPSADLSNEPASQAFFVVSKRKFALMFIVTCGWYFTFWFYMNWRRHRAAGNKVLPLARTVFGVFFVYSLFIRVDRRIKAFDRRYAWYPRSLAIAVIVLTFTNIALNWLNDPGVSFVLSLAITGLLAYCFLSVQSAINYAESDAAGLSNSVITWANGVWICIGLCMWTLAVTGYFLGFSAANAG